jgi:SAM-dependent methyltransferase
MKFLKSFLMHPLTKKLSVNDPLTTSLRKKILFEKKFLREIYKEWYSLLISTPNTYKTILEIGSGASFIKEIHWNVISSDIFEHNNIDLALDACQLPFANESLDLIVMTNVFHHIPSAMRFLNEAQRCLKRGGEIKMIEPWNNKWSAWVYKNLHPEPFNPDQSSWDLDGLKHEHLSRANDALAWIVFERDKIIYEKIFPNLNKICVKPIMPFSYLFSGGLAYKSFIPGCLYKSIRFIENTFKIDKFGMFAFIYLKKL